jgi:hypothetical protein
MTIAKQSVLGSFFAATVLAIAVFAFSTPAHAQTNYTLEENGSFYSQSGSFTTVSSCGLRSACKWVYNTQYTASNWLRWLFYSAHNYYNEHFPQNQSDQFPFIPTIGTTHSAKYCTNVWRYTFPYAPYEDTTTYCNLGLDQYAYYNQFVQVYNDPSNATEIVRTELKDATGENAGWYSVVWDAYKGAYY